MTKIKSQKFYRLSSPSRSGAPGWKLLNESDFRFPAFVAPTGHRGFVNYPAVPIFLFDRSLGYPIRDFHWIGNYFLISDRMRIFLDNIDSGACEFMKCSVKLRDGTDGPQYWLCDIVRIIDALDIESSNMEIKIASNGSNIYNVSFGKQRIKFIEDRVVGHHIFRLMYGEYQIYCDDYFKESCKKLGVKDISFRKNEEF